MNVPRSVKYQPMTHLHWPVSFLICTASAILCLLAGIAAFAGLLEGVHPLFNDSMAAGITLIVSAIALLLSGAFPLVLQRLAEQEK